MSRSPFQLALGTRQGRILPTEYGPVQGAGSYVFVLGDELARLDNLEVGDRVQVSQDLDLSSARMLLLDAQIRQPTLKSDTDISSGAQLVRGDVTATGDDLSAILSPNVALTAAHDGMPVKISGASYVFNNCVNRIDSVLSSTMALLRYPVQADAGPITAVIKAAEWKFSILIDGDEQLAVTPGSDDTWGPLCINSTWIGSSNWAVDVRKCTGVCTVVYRLELVLRNP